MSEEVTKTPLKRKIETQISKEESDEDCPQKKIAPLLDKSEITITPIQKVPVAASTSTTEDKHNGNAT